MVLCFCDDVAATEPHWELRGSGSLQISIQTGGGRRSGEMRREMKYSGTDSWTMGIHCKVQGGVFRRGSEYYNIKTGNKMKLQAKNVHNEFHP